MQFTAKISARNFNSTISKVGNIKELIWHSSKIVVKAAISIFENNSDSKSLKQKSANFCTLFAHVILNIYISIFERSKQHFQLSSLISSSLNCRCLYGFKTILHLLEK